MCTIFTRPLIVQELPQFHGTGRIIQLQYMLRKDQQIEHKKNKIYTFQNFPFHFHCQVITDSDAVY